MLGHEVGVETHSKINYKSLNETSCKKPTFLSKINWAASSEFVSSSIPSWQILTAHAQPFRGARDLAFCLKVPLDSLLLWASSEGSGETARMRRLAWTFGARIGDKYQIRLTRSNLTCAVTLDPFGGIAKCYVFDKLVPASTLEKKSYRITIVNRWWGKAEDGVGGIYWWQIFNFFTTHPISNAWFKSKGMRS